MLSGGPRSAPNGDQAQLLSTLPPQFQQTTQGGNLSVLLLKMDTLFSDYGDDLSLGTLSSIAEQLGDSSTIQLQQIADLQTQSDNLQQEISSLQGQVTSSQSLLTTLQSQVTINQNAIQVLQAQIVTANSLISTANAAIATIQQQILLDEAILATLQSTAATEDQIVQLQAQIDTNTATIANIQATIVILQGQISTNQGAIETLTLALQATNQSITDLETAQDGDIAAIAAIETSIDTINTTTQTLQGQINTTNASLSTVISTNTLQDSSISTLQGTQSSLLSLTATQGQSITDLTAAVAAININPSDIAQIETNRQNIAQHTISIDVNTNSIASTASTVATMSTTVAQMNQTYGSHLLLANGPGQFDVAYQYQNRVPPYVTADELLTWGFMKLFIDAMFPIGCIQLTLNTQLPPSFNGYLQWEYVQQADGRYLRLFGGGNNGGYTVGTLASGSIIDHTHTTPQVTFPAQTVTSSVNTTALEITSSYVARASAAGGFNCLGNTNATAGVAIAPLSVSNHVHTVTIPDITLSSLETSHTGTAKNECDSFTVAIYRRSA